MKKIMLILAMIVGIIGFSFACGYYIYKIGTASNEKENINTEIAKNVENALNENTILNHNNIIENMILPTSQIDDKVSPNATLVIKKNYKKCGHTTKDYAEVPAEIVNKTEEEVRNLYSNWEVKGFSSDEIVLYKELDGICDEHYVLKEKDGYIAIYTRDENDNDILKEMTSISTEYLTEQDLKSIKEGIIAIGEEKLNSLLEDFE